MPTLTRWFVRTALVYFTVALAVGAGMHLPPVVAAVPDLAGAWPAYLHLLMVGWVTQLIIGVAYWLFPRPDRSRPPPNDRAGWAAYILLNTGLLIRAVAEPRAIVEPGSALRWALPLAGILQLAAACAFVAVIWPRVRER